MSDYVNYVIQVEVPFDTREEAQAWAKSDEYDAITDNIADACEKWSDKGIVISGSIVTGHES